MKALTFDGIRLAESDEVEAQKRYERMMAFLDSKDRERLAAELAIIQHHYGHTNFFARNKASVEKAERALLELAQSENDEKRGREWRQRMEAIGKEEEENTKKLKKEVLSTPSSMTTRLSRSTPERASE
jgi:hypothetical protein